MPEGIANIANEEKIIEYLTLTAEPGVIGGLPNGGLNFGTGINMDCLIDQPYQFDFYDGGGLDVAFLGLAQADKEGNLNVSKFGPKLAGAGGFINISQNAKKIFFVGTFTAGDLQVSVKDGKLRMKRRKDRNLSMCRACHVQWNLCKQEGQPFFMSERCVFSLSEDGTDSAPEWT
jgi:propionate CoA-transferase